MTAAVVTVAATSFHVVVADFVKFFTGFVVVGVAFAVTFLFTTGSWDFISIVIEAIVFTTVFESIGKCDGRKGSWNGC